MIDRVVIEGSRAQALLVKARGEDVELRADTIILSAGTYGSPSILMRSGVGPGELLRGLGIERSRLSRVSGAISMTTHLSTCNANRRTRAGTESCETWATRASTGDR